ncbi:MAG: hypothetical protein GY882_04740, partial [Actinomycetia bacterium]|nr:hypothetical protein [Actinomycetes bacterium]
EAHATAVDLAVAASMVTGPSGLSCATAAALTISMAIDDELDVGTVIDVDALVELGITPPPVSWVQLLAPWHAFHAALPDTAVAVAVAGPMLDAVPDAPCVEAWRTSVASALGAVTTSQAAAMTPKRGTAAAAVIVSGPDVLAVDPGCDAVADVAEEPWAPESLRFHDALAAVAASTAAEVHSGAEHDVEADHDCDTEPGLPVCLAAAVLMLGPWPDQVAVWGADMPADRVAAADRARPSSAPLPPDVAVHPFGFVPDVLATARSLGGLVEGEGIRNAAVPATAGVGLAVERLSLDPADAHAAILVGIDRCGPTPLYGTQASPQATMAVEQVCDAAHADGVELTVVSAWRSPHAQEALHHQHGCDPHQTCVTADGTTIAPVGASHHQHGAAVDFAGDLDWLHDVVGCLDVASTVLHAAGPISAGTYADAVVAAAAVGAGTPAGLCGSGEVPVKRAQTFGLVPLCGQVSTAGWLAEASPGAADSWSTPEALRCEKGSNPTREPWHFYVGSRLVASTGVEAVIAALWPAEEVSNALEVVARESGGNPTISNVNTDGTTDWGLWQFNDGGTLAESYLATYGHAGTPAEHLAAALDPVSASEMALTLWTVRWWQPWAGATAAGINAGLWSFESGPNDASGGLYAGSGAAAMAVRAAALPG